MKFRDLLKETDRIKFHRFKQAQPLRHVPATKEGPTPMDLLSEHGPPPTKMIHFRVLDRVTGEVKHWPVRFGSTQHTEIIRAEFYEHHANVRDIKHNLDLLEHKVNTLLQAHGN